MLPTILHILGNLFQILIEILILCVFKINKEERIEREECTWERKKI